MADLLYSYEAWSRRAKVAEECAEELRELGEALSRVLERNYFGVGCVEGEALYASLHRLLRDGTRVLDQLGTGADGLASGAAAAIVQLSASDRLGAHLVGDN